MQATVEPLQFVVPTSIVVTRLKLTAFRCYGDIQLDLDRRPVMLTGPNGAGKTNLLEAVSYLAPGRGLRGAKISEPDYQGTNYPWAVAATITTAVGAITIGTGHNKEKDRRTVHINGAPANGPIALAEYVSAIWLTPKMDRLFREGPSARRRFLDRLIYGYHVDHASRVAGYEQATRERMKLLREGCVDKIWLGSIEADMAEKGVAIAAARIEVTARLDEACKAGSGPLSGASISVEGTLEEWLSENPALAVEERFKEVLAGNRALDAESGRTTSGPQKSDMIVTHCEKCIPASQCSTGEQKSLLIAILLANARLQSSDRGIVPLLLLDEAAAHLDASRRRALVNEILELGAQAWLSGTDEALFSEFNDSAQYVRISDGTVKMYNMKNRKNGSDRIGQ